MWEVIARSRTTGIQRQVTTDTWENAHRLAKRALDRGWRVNMKKIFRDVLIADQSGEFMVAAKKLTHQQAIEFYHCYSQLDTYRGCVIWPHGRKLPEGWKIVG